MMDWSCCSVIYLFIILKPACLCGCLHNYFSDFNDNEIFLWNSWPTRGTKHYFQPGLLSGILIIRNFWHVASRTWTFTKREFRLCWMTLCSTSNHYTIEVLMVSGFQNDALEYSRLPIFEVNKILEAGNN